MHTLRGGLSASRKTGLSNLGPLHGGGIPWTPVTVTVQPDATAGRDTFLRMSSGYQASNYASSDQLRTGEVNNSDAYGGERSLIKFTLPTLPSDARQISVTLRLYLVSILASVDTTLSAYRLKRDWVHDQVNRNVYATGFNWQTAGASGANDRESVAIGTLALTTGMATNQYHSLSFTATSLAELDLGYGWLLQTGIENNDGYIFASSNAANADTWPALVVTYQTQNP